MLKVKSTSIYRFPQQWGVIHTKMYLITFFESKSLKNRKILTKTKNSKALLKVSDINDIGILQQGMIYNASLGKYISMNKISPHVKVIARV